MSDQAIRFGLGRRSAPDVRDSAYPLREAIPREISSDSRTWRAGPALDQGDRPECVAYAWEGFLIAWPKHDAPPSQPQLDELYHASQLVDEFPDTPPAGGTSVRAGAKVLSSRGRIAEYRWAASIDDARDFILTRGTVVFGTDWHEAMFDIDVSGFVHPDGKVAGGHAYLVIGYSHTRDAFRILNSWGSGWGQHGRAWIHAADLGALLLSGGEACSAIEV